MIFKLHKTNMAPPESGLKDLQVQIQVKEHGSDASGGIYLGSSCRSKDELEHQIQRCIQDLKKLRFPK